jgi:hypothetical protein
MVAPVMAIRSQKAKTDAVTDMAMTPVFDQNNHILGYLDDEVLSRHRSEKIFAIEARAPLPMCGDMSPAEMVRTDRIVFHWDRISSYRDDDSGKIYRCDTLIAYDAEHIARIPGFKWFAEVHGRACDGVAFTLDAEIFDGIRAALNI